MPTLEVQNIVMDFPGVRALAGVSMAFEAGEVHGIIGENGAGKSTLMRILGGLQRPTSGELLIDDEPTSLHGVREALHRGIAMIHQELNLVDELSVADNVYLGREIARAGVIDRATTARETQRYLDQVHAPFPPNVKVGQLSVAGKQLVEIAKAVSANASVLIMDEPTAVLSEPEARSLFELIAKLKAQGTTILYISHRLAEICEICDRVTILRDGSKVATLSARGATTVELADLMVGRPLSDFYPPKAEVRSAEPSLTLTDSNGHTALSVRPGEIVGLAGLVGAGRTELAEAIVGLRPLRGYQLKVGGSRVRFSSPKAAMRRGIAYVSEDRKALGLHLSLSATHNITMANLRHYGTAILDRGEEEVTAQRWKKQLDIRMADLNHPVINASGGNQQKVAIAKWLETNPKVLILDEPTRGVDVGAKREIYDVVQRLARDGMACIIISSELPEILGLCHQASVMREGTIVGTLSGTDLTEEAVMHLAAGVRAA